ncbi:hypothetical protein UO65_3044 [Actinokineospora spheciospongiae]|uniref:Uncharacterized protein n=1 Tax=Actinokineospora spheciospongiae TaxID=909613 RepID=W7IYX0_9PSEU|nr:hypothetical protein [Actinokineospora spheciospongiae]EWC61686.1 hypothetical protein UO65_3044 [Actinokineospora spheciospongiae]
MRHLCWVALCLLALTGCGSGPGGGERACTLIGGRTGIGVVVDPGAPVLDTPALLTLCADGRCRDVPVPLEPATGTGASGCSGGVCSAQVAPTGGQVGFAEVDGLSEQPLEVTLTAGDREFRTTVTPAAVYPNGPDCGAAGVQGRVGLTAAGNLTNR